MRAKGRCALERDVIRKRLLHILMNNPQGVKAKEILKEFDTKTSIPMDIVSLQRYLRDMTAKEIVDVKKETVIDSSMNYQRFNVYTIRKKD